jgi:ribonuclease P protein component
MLAKKHKLNLKFNQNREVLRSPLKFKTNSFQLSYDFQGSATESAKVAVMAPKRIFAKASWRNNLRRKFYEALPKELLEINSLRLIVNITRQQADELSVEEITAILQPLVAKIKNHQQQSKLENE